MRHTFATLFGMMIFLCANSVSAQTADDLTHQKIGVVLRGVQEAISASKFEDLAQYFLEDMHMTTISQDSITAREQIGPYFSRQIGPSKKIKSLSLALKPDALAKFYGDKTVGIVHGMGVEKYVFNDGRELQFSTRWTATMHADADGKWRIGTIHFGTNFLKNPLLDQAAESGPMYAFGGFVGGTLFASIVAFVLVRLKRETDSPDSPDAPEEPEASESEPAPTA
jgi:ketosteroid isomerase-like protein